jgi:hypothetical protein
MNEFTKEELKNREIVEEKLYGVYKRSFAELFNSCMNNLPQETDLAATAFKVSKPELIVKACRAVLEKYEEAIYNIPNPDQLKMKLEEDK